MNMPTYGGNRQLTPHISSEGGVTMRADGTKFPWCADYAATKLEVPEEQWCTLAFTYDSKFIRAYINGVNFVSRVNQVPAADAPWQIPNSAIVGDIAPYLTPGSKRLVFKLFYNDSPGTPVDPQRSVEMNVTLQ